MRQGLAVIRTQIEMYSSQIEYSFFLCLCYIFNESSMKDMVTLLHSNEMRYYDSLKFDKRKRDYLIGRFAAKNAVSMAIKEQNLEKICIERGFFHQPIVRHPRNTNIQVSLTHCGRFAASVAFSEEVPLGIDIEEISERLSETLSKSLTYQEREMMDNIPVPFIKLATTIWTAKEALSKVTRTGLSVPLSLYEVNEVIVEESCLCLSFRYFKQYKAISCFLDAHVISLVLPTKLQIDKDELYRNFQFTKLYSGGEYAEL